MNASTIIHAQGRKSGSPAGSSGRMDIGLEALRGLGSSGYLALRDVSCDVRAETIRLHGRLPTYYLKQPAQAIVAEVLGVRPVVNLIEVVAPAGRPPMGRVRYPRAEEPVRVGHKPQPREGGRTPRTSRRESGTMLVLSRKLGETIVIDGDIRVTVVAVRGNQVRLGIEAPDRVEILREELCLPGREVESSGGPPIREVPLCQAVRRDH